MRFLIDAQLSPALAKLIREKGHEAEHVRDLGMRDADDTTIWFYALENNAVVVTKDDDFVKRSRQSSTAPVVVWLRIGNTSRKALLEWFEPLLLKIETLVDQGEKLIEVR